MKPRSCLHITVALLLAVPILWALLPPPASGNEYLLNAGGALAVGGPGEFIGKDGDSLAIHNSDTARTLCVTLEGKAGLTQADFGPATEAFSFSVGAAETKSVCRDAPETVDLTCVGADCETRWRVDALP